ncbi:PIMRE protein, partial [Rhinopomastus cyanomelas]|nr:PIMRE protein [Rhinopomastus cyanomelas]
TENCSEMASVLQNVKATMAWRKHQLLENFDENESPAQDQLKRRPSLSSLGTIRTSPGKRVPLKQADSNVRKTLAWDSLEPRQKCQTLQSIKRSARSAFGAVSQRILKSCQSPAHSALAFPAESPSSCAPSSARGRGPAPRTP